MAGTQTRDTLIKLVPRSVVLMVEKERARKRRYESRRPKRSGNRHKTVPNAERPFIMWDGEGPQDAGYALFGSSDGDEICHPFLSTVECLDLILSCETRNPDAVHIAFGFNYDASMILKDLPWRCLNALKVYCATLWNGYEIEHIPNKWFKVRKDGVTAQIFDIRNFFAGSYVAALESLGVGTPAEIQKLTAEKLRRDKFLFAEISDIRQYWKLELRFGPILAEKLRGAFLGAGFDLRSWHGPGALARLAMDKHHVSDAMAVSPVDVQIAARYAFAGGRFEMPRGGHVKGTVYNADLRSAYPGYARQLPNLSRGRWRRGICYEPGKFGVYHIQYRASIRDPLKPYPLFRRGVDGTVSWTSAVDGWYWAPEAALVAGDNDATFLESWVFDEDDETDRPFAWIEEYYERRALLKRMGNPLELTFKLILNSIYGQLAQRAGWDRKRRRAPRTHQLEWAGYITSACRAAVYTAALGCGDGLISIDTDGVYSMSPVPVVPGPRLGEWELNEYAEGIFWQSGIYALRTTTRGWEKGRTRGIPKGSYEPAELLDCLARDIPLRLSVNTFIGYGLALNGQQERLNTWIREPHEIIFGGQGKRYHNVPYYCARGKCNNGGGGADRSGSAVHHFIPQMEIRPDPHSQPHYLPWLDNDPLTETNKNLVADYQAYNVNDLEPDDEWVRDAA